ncbi:hypothetical protein [Bradyrhizobium iriomotense]|uniref:hypothetical protein n=1 Tax=Bradyrhizobium iriomotense TaxID=441950 RepID=UPI001B8A4C7C|nr:hypothetical protein [Bradyrhizobium iriomotense]MBR0780758.1 hypothetical protein [Bradyrhizobium iriomotense]
MSAPEWEAYKISSSYSELTEVRHIVHLPVARRIIEDGKIKSGLVFDKSRLNKSRISVAWLSANDWSAGSLYGTVEFRFSWERLVKHKRIYWVEAMPNYHPAAYRYLLTYDEMTSPLVTAYDPEKDDGPLRKIDGTWRWNREFTSEFMIADDLTIPETTGIAFVHHNQKYCRTKTVCNEQITNPTPQRTAGKLLAYILAHGVHDLDKHLQPDAGGRNSSLDMGSAWLYLVFDHLEYVGSITAEDACDNILKGALALFGVDKVEDGKKLLTLMADKERATAALARSIRNHFDSPGWDFGP